MTEIYQQQEDHRNEMIEAFERNHVPEYFNKVNARSVKEINRRESVISTTITKRILKLKK